MKNNLNTRDALFIFAVIMAIAMAIGGVIIVASIPSPPDDACVHRPTPGMRVFLDECLSEGYEFNQCYYAYVDAVEHGVGVLEMPKTWV